MKTKSRVVVLVLCLAVLVTASGCFFTGQSSDPTRATVELEGNPTTGYNWTCAIADDGVVSELSNEYVQDSNPQGASGVGGTFVFTFESVSEGETEIIFSYAREWEDTPIDTIIYQATVDTNLKLTLKEL